jgi:RNA polymerase sigma factor (sigma-70 family)
VTISAGVARGDGASLDRLYRAWFDRAFGLARRFTRRDEAFCLDIVQEAMLRTIRALKPQPTGAALDGWITLAVRSASVDALRREARRAARESRREVIGSARSGACSAERAELIELMARLDELDPAEAELLRRRFGGVTLRGLAQATGTTTGAAHGQVRRALAAFKRLFPKDQR